LEEGTGKKPQQNPLTPLKNAACAALKAGTCMLDWLEQTFGAAHAAFFSEQAGSVAERGAIPVGQTDLRAGAQAKHFRSIG